MGQSLCCRITFWVFNLQHLRDKIFTIVWTLSRLLVNSRFYFSKNLLPCTTSKRKFPSYHHIKNTAERPDITFGSVTALNYIRWHKIWGTSLLMHKFLSLFWKTEINNFDFFMCIKHNVFWFYISMGNHQPVHVV